MMTFGVIVHGHDPVAAAEEAIHEYAVRFIAWERLPKANAIACAVAHQAFKGRGVAEFVDMISPGGLFVDVKGMADLEALRAASIGTWRL